MSRLLLRFLAVAVVVAVTSGTTGAQRERIRQGPRRSTPVTQAQASELTLTVTEVAVRPIQVWVRTAGMLDAAGTTVSATLPASDGARVSMGQRVRAFSPESRSRMYQATVTQVAPQAQAVTVKAQLRARPLETGRYYVLEIVTDAGDFLSVPNEAILESGGTQVVYIQEPDGGYAPLEIQVGLRGELFTQVLKGLEAGQQVVTIGSFFIDAEHKLKGS